MPRRSTAALAAAAMHSETQQEVREAVVHNENMQCDATLRQKYRSVYTPPTRCFVFLLIASSARRSPANAFGSRTPVAALLDASWMSMAQLARRFLSTPTTGLQPEEGGGGRVPVTELAGGNEVDTTAPIAQHTCN